MSAKLIGGNTIASVAATSGPNMSGARPRLAHVHWLVTGFWRTRASLSSWALATTLIGTQLTAVYLSVWRNGWDRSLGDALQAKNGAAMPALVATFFIYLSVQVVFQITQIFLVEYVVLRWRTWLTQNYTARWLGNISYLSIERSALVDNPDQRMAEDLASFVLLTLTNFVNFVLCVTSISTFVVILWGLSSSFRFDLGSFHLALAGDLVWVSVFYMLGGSWMITRLGKPLIRRTMQQQHYEADFRYLLIGVRRNAEQIAFARGGRTEAEKLGRSFLHIYRNKLSLMRAEMIVGAGQSAYGNLQSILPLLLIMPRFFSGAITFGVLLQVRSAFEQLTASLSWFVQVYPTLATLTAIVNRLEALDRAIAAPDRTQVAYATQGADLRARDLVVSTPLGAPLLTVTDWTVARGETWAIRGPSGAGKSTLLRVLAGLWPDASGRVDLPEGATMMFVPQKLYIPVGTLRDALAFPDAAARFDDAAFEAALVAARLQELAARLDDTRPWHDELSPGEQQRLAFARILVRRPDILFLDEATSALDPANAQAMYDLLARELPQLTLVSIVHADVLAARHDRILQVENGTVRPVSAHEHQTQNLKGDKDE